MGVLMRLRHVGWLIAAALLCAGCGALHVDAYPTAPDTQTDCVGLYNDVPRTVAGQDERRVEDDLAVAWGDPPIILRCGVEKPEQLSPDARCDMVDGIGDRKSTRLNSSHVSISYAVFCLKKKKQIRI